MKFVTLREGDPQTRDLLRGTFSWRERAIPVDFYRPVERRDPLTLVIKDAGECRRGVSVVGVLGGLVRWGDWGHTLGIMLFLLTEGVMKERFQVGQVWVLLTVWMAQIGVYGLNDYLGHVSTADIRMPLAGSRVIQKGWLPAWQVLVWGLFWCGCALAMAGVYLLSAPDWPVVTMGLGLGAVVVHLVLAARAQAGREWLTGLIWGPLLILGFLEVLRLPQAAAGAVLAIWNGVAVLQQLLLRAHVRLLEDPTFGRWGWLARWGSDSKSGWFWGLALARWVSMGFVAVLSGPSLLWALLVVETVFFWRAVPLLLRMSRRLDSSGMRLTQLVDLQARLVLGLGLGLVVVMLGSRVFG